MRDLKCKESWRRAIEKNWELPKTLSLVDCVAYQRRLLTPRTQFLCGVLVIIVLMSSCGSVFSTQELMMIEASFNPSQTDQGVYVSVAGSVFDLNNSSLSNALISIKGISPQGSSVHGR